MKYCYHYFINDLISVLHIKISIHEDRHSCGLRFVLYYMSVWSLLFARFNHIS